MLGNCIDSSSLPSYLLIEMNESWIMDLLLLDFTAAGFNCRVAAVNDLIIVQVLFTFYFYSAWDH